MTVISHDVSACLLDPARTSFDRAAVHDGYSRHAGWRSFPTTVTYFAWDHSAGKGGYARHAALLVKAVIEHA